MDELDSKIIQLMMRNARMPVKEIAKQVNLTSPAVSSRPRYTIHVDPDMVQYWDDEDEDEFPLKEDPFFMWYGGEQQEEMGTGHYLATLLLFAIPVVGLIMMIYWSLCGSKWEERQKLATACMIKRLVGDLVILALLIAAHSVIVGLSYMPILLGGMGY